MDLAGIGNPRSRAPSRERQSFDGISLAEARQRLATELDRAYAPVSGLRVACVLETATGIYGGHNYEHIDPSRPNHAIREDHAEDAALAQLRQAERGRIERVYMAGRGHKKIKHVSPSSHSYATLTRFFSPTAEVVLFEPNTLDDQLIFTRAEHGRAYARHPYSEIRGTDRNDIVSDLKMKTFLRGSDLELVADLRLLGLRTGIHFFLTGSSTRRGGMSDQIHLKRRTSYEDLDIIAVTSLDRATVEALFDRAVEPHVGCLKKEPRILQPWFVDVEREGIDYSKDGRHILELWVAPTLKDGFARADYLQNNYFHQLS